MNSDFVGIIISVSLAFITRISDLSNYMFMLICFCFLFYMKMFPLVQR